MSENTQSPTAAATPIPSWAQRIEASLSAGRHADYADIEEGLAALLQDAKNYQAHIKELHETNEVLTSFFNEVQPLISTMAIARHFNNMPGVLAALDAFMEKRVVIKEEPAAASVH